MSGIPARIRTDRLANPGQELRQWIDLFRVIIIIIIITTTIYKVFYSLEKCGEQG
jgi:hypothetical protein